jgi:hypothetical protein
MTFLHLTNGLFEVLYQLLIDLQQEESSCAENYPITARKDSSSTKSSGELMFTVLLAHQAQALTLLDHHCKSIKTGV